jgi:hypothetical protein
VSGRPVPTVELPYRPWESAEEWTRLSLADRDLPDDKPPQLLGTFATTLQSCDRDLEYRVVAGPVESAAYHLHILHPLVLKSFQAKVEPPAYTRRPAQTVKDRDFKVIAGSAARVRITLDRRPERAELLLHPLNAAGKPADGVRAIPLAMEGAELTGTLPSLEREAEVEIVAEAADGMKLEGEHFRIRIQPDGKPTVRLVKPADTTEVTPSTEVHVRVQAGDDFGLSKVGIVYQIGNGPKKTLLLHQDPQQPAALLLESILALEKHPVSFQDGVSYYAFAEDNHPSRPQRATTELQFLDIRPYKRAYQMLKMGGS